MEEDKVNPNSQPSSALPSWQEDQGLSGQWVGAGGGSGLPLLDTEEEGAFVNVDEEWEDDMDLQLSQGGNVSGRELCPWEEVRVREFYQWQEVTVQWGDGTQQELYHREESMTVQELYPWDEDDDRYQELSHWEEDVTGQELPQSKGEGHQELSLLEHMRGRPHMYQWEVDERDPELSQVGDNSDKELSQGKDYNVQERPQWEKYGSDQKLSQQKESMSSQGLSQWGQGVSYKSGDKPLHTQNDKDAQTCAQKRPSSPGSVGTEMSGQVAHELPSTSPAPGSPTEAEPAAVAALTESPVPAPPSPPGCSQALLDFAQSISCDIVSQALLEVQASGQQSEEQRDLDQSMAAELEAPEEREESSASAPPSPLPGLQRTQVRSEQQEEAERWSVVAEQESEEGTLAGELDNDEEDAELSQREKNKYQEVSQGEVSMEQELSPGEVGSYQELSQGEASREQELSPGEVGSYQELSQGEASREQELSPGQVGSYQELSQGEASTEQELSPGEVGSYQELSQGEASNKQELSPGEVGSSQKLSQGEACTEQEPCPGEVGSSKKLSQGEACTEQEPCPGEVRSSLEFWEECTEKKPSRGEVGSSQKLSYWEEYSEQELSHEVGRYEELSDLEESIGQELSEEEDPIVQEVSKGNVNRPSVQSCWENNSYKELTQDNWEHVSVHSTWVKPLLQEDKSDELSILELPEEEDREQRLRRFAEDGLQVPVPREAWVEHQAFEMCPQVPFWALPPHLKAQATRGRPVSPAFKEKVPETCPALCSCPSSSAPQLGARALRRQQAPHKKHPSLARRMLQALRSLFCPCLRPPLEG